MEREEDLRKIFASLISTNIFMQNILFEKKATTYFSTPKRKKKINYKAVKFFIPFQNWGRYLDILEIKPENCKCKGGISRNVSELWI